MDIVDYTHEYIDLCTETKTCYPCDKNLSLYDNIVFIPEQN